MAMRTPQSGMDNHYFNVENVIMKQPIVIPIRIDPSPFWTYLFQYPYKQEYASSLISSDKVRTRNFHSKKFFINGLCVINGIGEVGGSFCDMYLKELHGDHVAFLNLFTALKEGTFTCKFFDNSDSFDFSTMQMPHI